MNLHDLDIYMPWLKPKLFTNPNAYIASIYSTERNFLSSPFRETSQPPA